MLVQLSIRDIVLIEALDVEFTSGLSVLTGETGAGKSILLDSLCLALGARGDASLVREGALSGQVTAIFDIGSDHAARRLLQDHGLAEDGDLILRRIQLADGRSRSFINDQPVTVGLMRDIGKLLVEIHGQHADRALMDLEMHRSLLDAFAGLETIVIELGQAFQHWQKALDLVQTYRSNLEQSEQEIEYWRISLKELEDLDAKIGEEQTLAESRIQMMRIEKIAVHIKEVADFFEGTELPIPKMASLLRGLERKSAEFGDLIDPLIAALDHSLTAVSDMQIVIDQVMQMIEFDPATLEIVEERLFALRAAARKYGVPVDHLPLLLQDIREKLELAEAGESKLAEIEKEEKAAYATYLAKAWHISEKRVNAARDLEKTVMGELPSLKLDHAEFTIVLETGEDKRNAFGLDQVEYWVRTNPGSRPGPLMKVASGGELSRFLLALKVALSGKGSAKTLVFDEIDTGLGGAVADAIGHRLQRLAAQVQVLAVTHAPQVAARAKSHFLIMKQEKDLQTGEDLRMAIEIAALNMQARQEEIARMLAGEHITEEARAAAQKLLINANIDKT